MRQTDWVNAILFAATAAVWFQIGRCDGRDNPSSTPAPIECFDDGSFAEGYAAGHEIGLQGGLSVCPHYAAPHGTPVILAPEDEAAARKAAKVSP